MVEKVPLEVEGSKADQTQAGKFSDDKAIPIKAAPLVIPHRHCFCLAQFIYGRYLLQSAKRRPLRTYGRTAKPRYLHLLNVHAMPG